MAMDKTRDPAIKKRKQIRRLALAAAGVVALLVVTFAIYSLEPAAYPVEREKVWMDTVKRGEMVRQVRGPGTLVPQEVRWLPARTSGRVEWRAQPGIEVDPDTVVLRLTNPELEQEVADAELGVASARADYDNLAAQLANQLLEREAQVAGVAADLEAAQLETDANRELNESGLIPDITLKRSELGARQLDERLAIERQRLTKARDGMQAQLAAGRASVAQAEALHTLRREQMEALAVRPGIGGVLQEVPVEVGQQVQEGTILARVARPDTLKASLQIPETQAKDVTIGQKAAIDTRNGVVQGSVVRIDPAVQNGYVTVDVSLPAELPRGARPDLSVDGTIEIERLDDVLYMARPSYGESGATIQLFEVVGDGDEAVRVNVELGRASVHTVEIVSGLEEGDRVILNDPSAWDGHDKLDLK
jgi:HlyD family secretion protein